MKHAELISIFFISTFRIFVYASTHLPVDVNNNPTSYALELRSQRSPKLLASSENTFGTKNFIRSKLPQNNGQPQLFNLGYSVRFESQNQNHEKPPEKTQLTNLQGDIITGTRKKNVEIDVPSSPHEEYQFGIKNDAKTLEIFRSKSTTSQSPIDIYFESTGQSYISPTTQKSLEVLRNIKDVDYQQKLSDLYQQKYTWRNLSPNVKIIKSTEIPIERIENRALHFDHQKALSKSEGFGFSDAIRDENFKTDHFVLKENILATPDPGEFRIVHVQEQINEPPVITKSIADSDIFNLRDHEVQKNVLTTTNNKPLKKPPIETVNTKNTDILQAVDGTPLKSQSEPELTKSQIPKQAYIQQIVIPQMAQLQFASTPKYRGKFRYIKHSAGHRGNSGNTRKVVTSLDYTRKAKIRPDLRREFKPPPGFRI